MNGYNQLKELAIAIYYYKMNDQNTLIVQSMLRRYGFIATVKQA